MIVKIEVIAEDVAMGECLSKSRCALSLAFCRIFPQARKTTITSEGIVTLFVKTRAEPHDYNVELFRAMLPRAAVRWFQDFDRMHWDGDAVVTTPFVFEVDLPARLLEVAACA